MICPNKVNNEKESTDWVGKLPKVTKYKYKYKTKENVRRGSFQSTVIWRKQFISLVSWEWRGVKTKIVGDDLKNNRIQDYLADEKV